MSIKLFVTGIDTEVGKTHISVGLLNAFNNAGYSTIGSKPIATDAFWKDDALYNNDALLLQESSSIKLPYQIINPIILEEPIAPHIAAKKMNTELCVKKILPCMQKILNTPADVHIVEGIGGWHVPLNNSETMADVVRACDLSVVLIVAIQLGCLNHAILSFNAIKQANLSIAGWVANFPTSAHALETEEIISTLFHWIDAPCLGIIHYQENAASILDIKTLLFNARITR